MMVQRYTVKCVNPIAQPATMQPQHQSHQNPLTICAVTPDRNIAGSNSVKCEVKCNERKEKAVCGILKKEVVGSRVPYKRKMG